MNHWSLKSRIYFMCGVLMAVALGITILSFYTNAKVKAQNSEIIYGDVPQIRALNRMLLNYRMARIELMTAISSHSTPEDRLRALATVKESWAHFDEDIELYGKTDLTPEEVTLFKEYSQAASAAHADFTKALTILDAHPAQDSKELRDVEQIVFKEIRAHGLLFRDASRSLVDFNSKSIDTNISEAADLSSAGQRFTLLVLFLGLGLGVLLSWVFSRALVNVMQKLEHGLSEASTQVASAATQIASSSQELSQCTTEQAASLQETAASIEEMNSMVAKNTTNSRSSSELASVSRSTAQKGQEAMGRMVDSIGEINVANNQIVEQIEKSNAEITSIVKVIEEIGSKTKVINDIVFQTKLLSFNASVEAARAGEHGKGFAVVAEEVGNLAQMSGNAAKEISTLLESSISKVNTIVEETKSRIGQLTVLGRSKIEDGNNVARQCEEILGEIASQSDKVFSTAKEIAVATEEQSHGIQEITKAMHQLDQVTQANASTSEQAASSAEQLSAQSMALRDYVTQLSQVVNGAGAQSGGASLRVNTRHAKHSSSDRKNVIQLKAYAEKNKGGITQKAVGSSFDAPDANDARFEDI